MQAVLPVALSLAASLVALPPSVAAKPANLLVNGDFSAGTVGWSGFTLSDGRPLMNLLVNEAGELTLVGMYDRCDAGDPKSCQQYPMSPMLTQTVSLTAGTYKLSWDQHNAATGYWPGQAFDLRVLNPGEPLYYNPPGTPYYYRIDPDLQGPIWTLDPSTGRYGNAPPTRYTYKFSAPVDGIYTINLSLHQVGRNLDSYNPPTQDSVWVDNLYLRKVCKKSVPVC